MSEGLKFLGDINVGKLVRWLRMMGFDTGLFTGDDDSRMVTIARDEGRIILTRDTRLVERRPISSGQVRALLLRSEKPEEQMKELLGKFEISGALNPFSLCIECNLPLVARSKDAVAGKVPPYVFMTKEIFNECPGCRRIYWRGTHWEAMKRTIVELVGEDV